MPDLIVDACSRCGVNVNIAEILNSPQVIQEVDYNKGHNGEFRVNFNDFVEKVTCNLHIDTYYKCPKCGKYSVTMDAGFCYDDYGCCMCSECDYHESR